jgi:hypothetical protein
MSYNINLQGTECNYSYDLFDVLSILWALWEMVLLGIHNNVLSLLEEV